MADNDEHTRSIPTLTDVACPGEVSRPRGLWLPRRTGQQPDLTGDTDWHRRLPRTLRPSAEALLKYTRARAHAAAVAAIRRRTPH